MPAADQDAQVAALARFGEYVRTLDDSELEQRYGDLVSEHRASPSADTAIRLALLLGDPQAPPYALDEALRLLRDAESAGSADDAEFARLTRHLLSDRSLTATDNGALTRLLASERDRSSHLSKELEELRAALAAERRQRAALEQQLDALKAVEAQIDGELATP